MDVAAAQGETTALAIRSTALAERHQVEGFLTFEDLFEAPKVDNVATILAEYREQRERVERIAAIFTNPAEQEAVAYFIQRAHDEDYHFSVSPERLFDLPATIKVMDACYWQRVLGTTDVYAAMPQERRDQWDESIRKRTTVPFEETTVLLTLERLLADRKLFFAEKVDGLFRALSGEHVTNSPLGFGQRMILKGVYEGYHSTARCGYVADLREIVARFMGREVMHYRGTWEAVKYAREYHTGEWVDLDGGAIRIRVYLNGNGHLQVHPEIAWRLNCVLHSLHPNAIASEHRQRPRKVPKDWPLFGRPLPFRVLGLLHRGEFEKPVDEEDASSMLRRDRYRYSHDDDENVEERIAELVHAGWRFKLADATAEDGGKIVQVEAGRVLESLGGVRVSHVHYRDFYDFTYDPRDVIKAVVVSGCLPDRVAYQYYPTPPSLAARVVEAAEIGPAHTVLEPSAGQGALADLLPRDRTVCVEVSELHYKVLDAKGHDVVRADFLRWKAGGGTFDRVVMNPPFTRGADIEHVTHALGFVRPGGILVAITSPSWENAASRKAATFRERLESFQHETEVIEAGAFKSSGTGIATMMLKVWVP